MRKYITALLSATLFLGFASTVFAADKAEKRELDDRIRDANSAAKKPGMMKVAVHTVSIETGVPEARVEEMHKRFDETGVAGLMIACVMADETKKNPEDLIKQHEKGKSWRRLADDNHVSLEKLNARLEHLERSLSSPAGEERKDRKERKRKT